MLLKVGLETSANICDDVVHKILNIYPEEGLESRPIFMRAFSDGSISYKELVGESQLLYIPWQMFFLDSKNFDIQVNHINTSRENKFSPKFFAKRSGVGKITSKRIIDRLIRLQNYIINNHKLAKNEFCGLLKHKTYSQCVKIILNLFEINDKFYSKTKEGALKYLINQVESKYINVSRGVLKGGILPEVKGVSEIYKNTSGFVIRDECIPFIFLPDEINPDEVAGRRIYTLIYLLVCIGLDNYNFYIESEFRASAIKTSGPDSMKHDIVAEILLPNKATDKLRDAEINKITISQLASSHKMTPTAVVVTLRRRNIITKEEYESLLPEPYQSQKHTSSPRTKPRITTSVEKFCGKTAFNLVNKGIKNKSLKSVEAQYLIFGRVRKGKYKEFCKLIGA